MKKIFAIIKDNKLFTTLENEFQSEEITRLDYTIPISKNLKDITNDISNHNNTLFIITDLPIRDLYTIYMSNTLATYTSRIHFITLTEEVSADALLIGYEFGTLDIISKNYEKGTLNKIISFVCKEAI